MSEKIQKIKEWIVSSRPQFDILEQDGDTIRVVQRLSDNKIFRLKRYPCSAHRDMEITKFCADRVHVLCTVHYPQYFNGQKIYLSSCWKSQINGLKFTEVVDKYGGSLFELHLMSGFFDVAD